MDIWVAKIATKVDQVVDVFYVRDFDAQKVDAPEKVAEIQSAVTAVLGHQGQLTAPERRPVVTTRKPRKAKAGT
jgi:UTP:GlnB (protein PII) uridylyltransferase